MIEDRIVRKIKVMIQMDRPDVEFELDLEKYLPKKLTPMQYLVYSLLQRGYTYREIANELGISKEMVRQHNLAIKKKIYELYYNEKIMLKDFNKAYSKARQEIFKERYGDSGKILKLFKDGFSPEEIASELYLPVESIKYIINNKHIPIIRRFSKNG